MSTYRLHQEVEVVVERVFSFGVFVRLPDGREGYIRRRELHLDMDVEPSQMVQEGDRLAAIIIGLEDGKRIELSHRLTLKDPWPEFVKQHRIGDVVQGSVRALLPSGAFVRVQAGISGFVPSDEIATWKVEKPDEVLWIGDAVQARITDIDEDERRLTLSIRNLMMERDGGQTISSTVPTRSAWSGWSPPLLANEPISPSLRDRVGQILVVEDQEEVRRPLTEWLRQRGFLAEEAESLETALQLSETGAFRVWLVDLNLVHDDGLMLAQKVHQCCPNASLCVMSNMETLLERLEEISRAGVAQVFPKPLSLEDIEEFLIRLGHGEVIPKWQPVRQTSKTAPAVEAAQNILLPFKTRIQQVLEEFTRQIRAEMGLLFYQDDAAGTITILARAGEIPLREEALYGLVISPVEDVIQEGTPIFEMHVSEQERKFAHLLELLPFESCIGVPVQVNEEIRHALFFFHREAEAFSHYRLRDAQAAALLISALLTHEALEKRLQSLNPMLLTGELSRGFGHEVANKITALEMEARLLFAPRNAEDFQAIAHRLFNLIADLKTTVQAFQSLLQKKGREESFDVNQVLQQTILLLRWIAQKEHIRIETNLATELPPVWGEPVILQQVFANLILNAIQQMALKAEKFHWQGQRLLRVTTSLTQEKHIRCRITDNGPGIHQAHLQKIFVPGFSTRGGSGLGLAIARSFVRSLGGELRVQETFVPLGTTFVVELPSMKERVP